MGHVLAVVSQKGGVGKTTTVVNLAAALARRGMRTVIVDVDPQGSVRHGAGLPRGYPHEGIADYLSGARTLPQIVLQTALPWLHVVLAGSVTDRAEHEPYLDQLGGTPVIREILGTLAQQHDVVVVDTPPGLGPAVRRVLEASEHIVVPLQCEPLALQTTPQILRGIQDVSTVNPSLALSGILLTMYDQGSPLAARVADYVRSSLPDGVVFDTVVPRSAGAVEAFAAGQPVVLRDPDDPASRAYTELAETIAEQLR